MPVASFTKEVNWRLAKRPLVFNGRLANPELSCLVKEASGVGVTKAPFIIFPVSKIFDFAKITIRFVESHLYSTGVTAAELRRHLSNINVQSNT